MEIAFAFSKCTQEKLQAITHVTNAKDDSQQLAADVVLSLGFDELEQQCVFLTIHGLFYWFAVGSSIGKAGTYFNVIEKLRN